MQKKNHLIWETFPGSAFEFATSFQLHSTVQVPLMEKLGQHWVQPVPEPLLTVGQLHVADLCKVSFDKK